MTISELITALARYPGDTEVLVAQNGWGKAALCVEEDGDLIAIMKQGGAE